MWALDTEVCWTKMVNRCKYVIKRQLKCTYVTPAEMATGTTFSTKKKDGNQIKNKVKEDKDWLENKSSRFFI